MAIKTSWRPTGRHSELVALRCRVLYTAPRGQRMDTGAAACLPKKTPFSAPPRKNQPDPFFLLFPTTPRQTKSLESAPFLPVVKKSPCHPPMILEAEELYF